MTTIIFLIKSIIYSFYYGMIDLIGFVTNTIPLLIILLAVWKVLDLVKYGKSLIRLWGFIKGFIKKN